MASVFQRDGRWIAKFKGPRGLWESRSCGDADKQKAKEWAAAWEADARDLREGRTDPRAAGFNVAALRPLAEHVADFKAMLAGKGNTAEHVSETVAHIERVAARIGTEGAKHLADLSADSVRKVVAAIRDEGRSLRTCNSILRSVKTFCGWLESDGRVRHADVRNVKAYNAETDHRRERRDLTDDEYTRIIAAAKAGGESFGMSGADRAIAYQLAGGTGFRRGEIASMTPASFTLEGDEPAVRVAAGYSKRRRGDEQPISPGLAAALAEWLKGKAKGARVLPLPHKTAEMLRGDMRLARARWIKEAGNAQERRKRRASDFLAAVDSEGRHFDFHAFRHHYISQVARPSRCAKSSPAIPPRPSPLAGTRTCGWRTCGRRYRGCRGRGRMSR